MKIKVRDTTMVRPSSETPRHGLWLSKVDRAKTRVHVPCVHFYRPNGCNDFFDIKVMKESLRRALVPFYPVAGRLQRCQDGRLEVNFNGDGVLFVEADAEGEIDDFGDFAPTVELGQLIPKVDYENQDISSYSLMIVQVTFFKCGGICLGIAMHHTVLDGYAAMNFLNAWSDLTRGMDVNYSPIIGRTILRARNPPKPAFEHIEYKPSSTPQSKLPEEVPSQEKPQRAQLSGAIFKFTREQLSNLKERVKKGDKSTTKYTTFECLSVHIWRCVCLARDLDDGVGEQTVLHVPVDGRRRLRPDVPDLFLGNVVFKAVVPLFSADHKSRPMHYAAGKIHEAVSCIDDNYLRSLIDCLELQPDLGELVGRARPHNRSDLKVVNWARLPIHEADFGWGKPIFMGPVITVLDGSAYILPSPCNDGSLSVSITLQSDAMRSLEKLIYDI